jgi:hypothetical protein
VHHGFVAVEQAVARLVVGGGPACVPGKRVAAVDHHPVVAGDGLGVEQPPYLGQPAVGVRVASVVEMTK